MENYLPSEPITYVIIFDSSNGLLAIDESFSDLIEHIIFTMRSMMPYNVSENGTTAPIKSKTFIFCLLSNLVAHMRPWTVFLNNKNHSRTHIASIRKDKLANHDVCVQKVNFPPFMNKYILMYIWMKINKQERGFMPLFFMASLAKSF